MTKNTIIKLTKLTSMLLTLGVFILPGHSMAQQYYDPGLLHKTIDRKPADFQPPGVHLGSFLLQPGVELAYENNDNIFYLENDEISDSIIHVRPWVNLNSDWSRHELNLSFYADIGRYSDFSSEDYEDWITILNGRIEVKRASNFNYKASYMQLHEDRSSPEDVGGIKPTEFTFSGYNLGYSHTINRLTAALNYDVADTDYDDNINGDGDILDNQDRDRSRDALVLRLTYELSDQSSVFFSATGNNIDYDQKIDNSGFERSSDGYNLQGGVSWNMTGVLVGDLYLEYINQDYDEVSFENVKGWGIGANLNWTPTELTNVNFLARNGPQETTQGSASGYFSSLYSIRVQHELRRNWQLNARFSYTNNNYEIFDDSANALTDTQVTRAGLGLSYLFNRNFYISGGYVYEKQAANLDRFEYKTNRWFVTFGAEL